MKINKINDVLIKLLKLMICPIVLLISGCASILDSGAMKSVQISSSPDKANITIVDDRSNQTVFNGITPQTVSLKRSSGFFKNAKYTINFTKDGYQDQSVTLKSGPSGLYIGGNLIFGGLLGWLIVDPATGAMWKLPKEVHTTLESSSSSLPQINGEDLVVMTFQEVPEGLIDKLVPINN